MCTLVAALNPNSSQNLLFLENRDRPVEGFKGHEVRLIGENRLVSLYDFRSGGIVCGYSMKTGIFGGIANVSGYVGPMSRGLALRDSLVNSLTLREALSNLKEALKKGQHSSANYILGDSQKMFRLENFGEEVRVAESRGFEVLTNNFSYLKAPMKLHTSEAREKFIVGKINSKPSIELEDFMAIATHHGKADAVCRHGKTLGSFVFFTSSHRGDPTFMYSLGRPCKGYRIFKP